MHKDGIFIFSATRLKAPFGFEDVWQVIESTHQVETHISKDRIRDLSNVAAILLIGDPQSDAQVDLVCMIARSFNRSAGENSPPIFWMPHSSAPDGCANLDDFTVHEVIMNNGVDDILSGEPEGHELALNLRCRISKQRLLSDKVNKAINKRREFNAKAEGQFEFLRESINSILWDYLRLRLHPECPPGIPPRIDGYQLATPLGSGNFGKVFALAVPGRGLSGQVVKCIPKSQLSHLVGLRSIKNQIQILKMMTENNPHSNIVRFGAVYHTETHILLRMEDGGHMNLFKRLKLREKEPADWSLHLAKVLMLVSQAIQAVAHLHSCQVVHRDIKPENICIRETGEEISLKLTDFDVAIIAHAGLRSSHLVGTFPFIAPEVVAEDTYDPYPSDIWSLGILFCEIGCGAQILDDKLQITSHFKRHNEETSNPPGIEVAKLLIKQVADYFREEDAAGRMLDANLRPELLPIADPLRFMLNQMIRTQAERRYSAPQVLQLSQTLQQQQQVEDAEGAELMEELAQ